MPSSKLMRRVAAHSRQEKLAMTLQADSGMHLERYSKLMRSESRRVHDSEAIHDLARSKVIDFSVPRHGNTTTGMFIGGKYIELGFRNNDRRGALGTDDKPADFQGGQGASTGIGLVSNELGFDAGHDNRTNEYIGHHESFWIGYNFTSTEAPEGTLSQAHNCGSSMFTQLHGTTDAMAMIQGGEGNLQMTQQVTLGVDDKFVRFDIRLHNTHESDTLFNVRYMRTCNPENTVDHNGSASTHQTYEECTGCPERGILESAVSHKDDAYYKAAGATAKFLYYSEDPRAKISHGSSGNAPVHGVYDPKTWESQPDKGAKQTADSWMAISFEAPKLEPGRDVDFTFFIGVGDDNISDMSLVLQRAAGMRHGQCDMVVCNETTSVRSVRAPVTCAAETCEQSECCVPRATCDTFLGCHKFGSYIAKDPNTSHFCLDEACDDTEPLTGESNDDRDSCCDLECEAHVEDDCPTDRSTNPCALQHGTCSEACSHWSTEDACPVNGSSPDGEWVWCTWQDGSCRQLGSCEELHPYCPSPLVPKMSFPMVCAGVTCSIHECCGSPAACNYTDCPGPELVLSDVPSSSCARTECEEHECCVPNVTDPSAMLESSDQTWRFKSYPRLEGLLDTPAGRRDPDAHPANLICENRMLAKRKKETAQSPEQAALAESKRSAAEKAKTDDVYAVTRMAETANGKFIGGKYIELGFRTNSLVGKMGTSDKPGTEFHGRRFSNQAGVGMTSNALGFANDAMNDATIDYFLPGSPEEGFYGGYDGGNMAKNFATEVTVSKDDTYMYSTIVAMTGDLRITQTFKLGLEDKWYRVDVTMENTGAAEMSRVRFMRSHDPDNTKDEAGSYATIQKVLRCGAAPDPGETIQPCPSGAVAVSAQSTIDGYFATTGHSAKVLYYSTSEYAWAAWGSSGLAPRNIYDDRVWAPRNKDDDTSEAGSGAYANVAQPGSEITRDAFISICFEVPTLAAGESVDMTFFTALDLLDIPEIAAEVVAAEDGPGVVYPSCDDHNCPLGMIEKADAPNACESSGGLPVCMDLECCDPLGSCSNFLCREFGDFVPKSLAESLYCAGINCDSTLPTEGTNTDLSTCCDIGCTSFSAADCPVNVGADVRAPEHACSLMNGECVHACSVNMNENQCRSIPRCTVIDLPPDRAQESPCTERGDCSSGTGYVCTAPNVLLATLPDYCVGSTCTDDDCCGSPGVCAPTDCSEGFQIKTAPPLCGNTQCTNAECCDPIPAGVAAHFGSNLGAATASDFLINCTVTFPYLTLQGTASSSLNLHVTRTSHGIYNGVDLQDNDHCRPNNLGVYTECVWQYDYNQQVLRGKDKSLCSGSTKDWECCLEWNLDNSIRARKCSNCYGPYCNWCNLIIDEDSRLMVLLPMSQSDCPATESNCQTVGNSCLCMAGNNNDNDVVLYNLGNDAISLGYDDNAGKDCRVRFAGFPAAGTGFEGTVESDPRVVSYTGDITDADALQMQNQILALTGESQLTETNILAALNADIIAPGTTFEWPASFLEQQVWHTIQLASKARASPNDYPHFLQQKTKLLSHTEPVFSDAVGDAMLEQLLKMDDYMSGVVSTAACPEGAVPITNRATCEQFALSAGGSFDQRCSLAVGTNEDWCSQRPSGCWFDESSAGLRALFNREPNNVPFTGITPVCVQDQATLRFMLSSSGTNQCVAGGSKITDKTICEDYANSLGTGYTFLPRCSQDVPTQNNHPWCNQRPTGCFKFGDFIYFNIFQDNVAVSDSSPVCQGKANSATLKEAVHRRIIAPDSAFVSAR